MFPGRFGPGGPIEGADHVGWHLLWFGVSSLLWLLVLGLLVWALTRFFTRRPRLAPAPMSAQPATDPQSGAPSAVELLRRRYAAGEIDSEMYDAMMERINAPESPNPTLL